MEILQIDSLHSDFLQMMQASGFNIIDATKSSEDELIEQLKFAEGLVLRSRMQINKSIIDRSPHLKFVARAGSGIENIDVDYCNQKGITVINSPEGNCTSVAEHALGMLLSTLNNICHSNQQILNGEWDRLKNRGTELEGKTLGIIGFGNTGKAFSTRLNAFGVTQLVYDKYLEWNNDSYSETKKSSIEEIKEKADIVSLHVPLNAETKYMIDKTFFESCSKNIILINTSRGSIVNTKDLIASLKNGKVTKACLDVIEFEELQFEGNNTFKDDPTFKELLTFPQVLLTPHIAGWTHESNRKIATVLAEKIIKQFA
ncbi:MAG TPA: NAD(P)-dependent oxidoreductase [Bacteroidia bacterium]|nr:NAD(P)-dependent oxidoreductase [Bacteroidia bacterium]HNT79286.1 NAD(P)-dependent oxidoreductase [Bacteroidia bacterium]